MTRYNIEHNANVVKDCEMCEARSNIGSSIKEIGFIILNVIVIFSIFVGAYIIRFKAVIKKVKAGSMYCVEAEYIETSGKYHITYLRGYKSPSVEGYDLTKREPLEKGDRVIVLVMRYPAWVYKARE